jgi:phosphoglycolate phosphatase
MVGSFVHSGLRRVTKQLLMLDYDGVVVDSLEISTSALAEACRQAGVARVASAEDALALFEGNVYDRLRAAGAAPQQIEEVVARFTRAVRVALPALRPFPLMQEVMAELAEARYMVIVTSNTRGLVEVFLRRHGIRGVAEIAGAEAGESKVTKIEKLMGRFAQQKLHWFVSDTAGDMREARLAGATPLGVAWGWHAPALLEEAGAERIAATPADLLAIVAPELRADFFGIGEGE